MNGRGANLIHLNWAERQDLLMHLSDFRKKAIAYHNNCIGGDGSISDIPTDFVDQLADRLYEVFQTNVARTIRQAQ